MKAGDPITDGPFDPKELMEIKGIRETQLYLVEEVQRVYRDQGVSIHDKHIELIVRQMTRRIGVQEPGGTDFLPGERVDAKVFRDTNRRMVEEGSAPPRVARRSWASPRRRWPPSRGCRPPSFQETTRVLTEAAIDGRGDNLIGLKENIIIGKLIPAGTGMMRYREFDVEAPDYQPMTFYSSDAEEDPAAWLSNIHGTYDGEAAAPAPAEAESTRSVVSVRILVARATKIRTEARPGRELGPMTVRVVVADDNYLLREGLERLLATVDDLEVVASVGDHDSLLAAVDEHRPDAVLADIRMPPTHTDEGVRAALAIRARHPETGVVMLSQHASPTYTATAARRDDDRDRLPAQGPGQRRRTSSPGRCARWPPGGSVVDPLVMQELIAARRVLADSPLAALTEREQEVLAAMAEGAQQRGDRHAGPTRRERTVEKHIATIFTKLELANEPDTNRRVKAVLVYLTELSR